MLTQRKSLEKYKDHLESAVLSGTLAVSIITLDYVRIGMTLVTVLSVTVASISMIAPITKLDGNRNVISKGLKRKDGEESVTLILQLKRICNRLLSQ